MENIEWMTGITVECIMKINIMASNGHHRESIYGFPFMQNLTAAKQVS
jgi:hypothetical protein